MKPSDVDKSRVLAKNMICDNCKAPIEMSLRPSKIGSLEWISAWKVACKCQAVEVGLGPEDFMSPYEFATQVSYEHRPKCWPPLVSNDEGLNFNEHADLSGL